MKDLYQNGKLIPEAIALISVINAHSGDAYSQAMLRRITIQRFETAEVQGIPNLEELITVIESVDNFYYTPAITNFINIVIKDAGEFFIKIAKVLNNQN